MDIRGKLAENADMPDFRAYAWKGRKRFDYSTEDAITFHRAIEDVVVPAAKRIFDRRRERLGVETLRPWYIGGGLEFHHPKVDPLGRDSLHPFTDFKAFEDTLQTVFNKVDPSLGTYFKTMRDQDSMDIENRNNKHGGAFCAPLSLSKRPFVFGNATGTDEDIRMMLHECGHAFTLSRASPCHIFINSVIRWNLRRSLQCRWNCSPRHICWKAKADSIRRKKSRNPALIIWRRS
jgi:oligoendopeptidase F